MSEHLDRVAAYLAKQPWATELRQTPDGVEVRQEWFGTSCTSLAHLSGSGPTFIYDTICPVAAAPAQRTAVAHFAARVNYELVVGAFSVDWLNGTVRCRSAVDIGGHELTDALMSGAIHPHHQALLDFFTHLLGVVRGEMDADEAFTEAMEQRR